MIKLTKDDTRSAILELIKLRERTEALRVALFEVQSIDTSMDMTRWLHYATCNLANASENLFTAANNLHVLFHIDPFTGEDRPVDEVVK